MPYQEPLMEQVNQALASILADSRFNASPQMSAFLSYIVKQTLAGHADRIKAYTIAVDALGKSDDFDPQTNPSVRVLAKRLRDTLGQFYASEPDIDVKICLKPGSYVPQFETFETENTHLKQAKAPSKGEPHKLLHTKLGSLLSNGFAKHHRPMTLVGVMLMAALAWNISPHQTTPANEPAIASAKPAQTILAIDIASMEQINRSQERPPLPSLTIINDNRQDKDYRLISNVIRDNFSRYEHVIVAEAPENKKDAHSPKWPEEYLLHFTRIDDNQVDMFVSHAKSGKIIQRANIDMPSDMLDKNQALLATADELTEFSRSLLKSDGAILQDYRQRGELTPTMECAFLFDAYYANKTKANRNAATQCAEYLHTEGRINFAPLIL